MPSLHDLFAASGRDGSSRRERDKAIRAAFSVEDHEEDVGSDEFSRVIQRLKQLQKGSVGITYGPLTLNPNTVKFQKIVEKILDGKEYTITSNQNSRLVIQFAGESTLVDLSEILRTANLTQLRLSPEYHRKYEEFLSSGKSLWQPSIDKQTADEAAFRKRDTEHRFQNLSFAEMAAINIYTQGYYSQMNDLMRGLGSTKSEQELTSNILSVAFASQGLSEIEDQPIPTAFRGQAGIDAERFKAAEKGGVSFESGFISTSVDGVIDTYDNGVSIMFHDMYGKNIGPLAWLPSEQEFLIPPTTQIKWEGHQAEGGKHYFIARSVSTPGVIERDPIFNELITKMISLKKDYESQLGFFDIFNPKIKKRLSQINEYLGKVASIMDNSSLQVDRKYEEVCKTIRELENKLNNEEKLFNKNKSRLLSTIEDKLEPILKKIQAELEVEKAKIAQQQKTQSPSIPTRPAISSSLPKNKSQSPTDTTITPSSSVRGGKPSVPARPNTRSPEPKQRVAQSEDTHAPLLPMHKTLEIKPLHSKGGDGVSRTSVPKLPPKPPPRRPGWGA